MTVTVFLISVYNVELPLFLIRHYNIRTCWSVEVNGHFLALVTLLLEIKSSNTQWLGGWVF